MAKSAGIGGTVLNNRYIFEDTQLSKAVLLTGPECLGCHCPISNDNRSSLCPHHIAIKAPFTGQSRPRWCSSMRCELTSIEFLYRAIQHVPLTSSHISRTGVVKTESQICSMVYESSAVNTFNERCYYTSPLTRPTTQDSSRVVLGLEQGAEEVIVGSNTSLV
ncbi:hypothetical protein TCAL_15660 [Tigriopus californicus]|uniref:Uncharacterized protein n=1 Tax=Tigriopus californicus TaxID=6832 RepID=A0A553PC04_TIGCA|nr:hypothetical protein TCAL_15660 [Tigriopus californicus]